MTVVTQKLLPSAKIVAKKKTIPVSALKPVEIENSTKTSSIKEKLILIKNFLGEKYERGLTSWRMKRRQRQEEKRKLREEKIEKKKETKLSLPTTKVRNPLSNIFDSISNFLLFLGGGILFNNFFDLQDGLTAVEKILPTIEKGILFFTGTLSNVTNFIDSAYVGYDKFKKQISDITGVKEEEVAKFAGLLNKVINGTIIAAMITLRALPGILRGRGRGGIGKDMGSGRSGFSKRQVVNTKGNQSIRRYIRRHGIDAARKRFGNDAVKNLGGKFGRSTVTNLSRNTLVKTFGKVGTKKLLQFSKNYISPIVKKIPLIGALLDFALNYFVFKEPLGRAAFKAIGAGLGLWIGGALGTLIGGPVGTFVGGFAGSAGGDALGGVIYDAVFGKSEGTEVSQISEYTSYEQNSETILSYIQPIEREV